MYVYSLALENVHNGVPMIDTYTLALEYREIRLALAYLEMEHT